MLGRAGMDKFVAPDIDTDMIDVASSSARGIKKDQVTSSQIASTDILAVIGLFSGDPGESHTFALADDILRKSGAVKSVGTLCTPDIASAQISLGRPDDMGIAATASAALAVEQRHGITQPSTA